MNMCRQPIELIFNLSNKLLYNILKCHHPKHSALLGHDEHNVGLLLDHRLKKVRQGCIVRHFLYRP